MKLYHIDRSGHLSSNQILNLTKNFYTEVTENEYFKDGLSSHGVHYYLDDIDNRDHGIDVIFEYERMINFPNKLSRYQSLFAFDINGVIDFINKKELNDNFYKIYEIEAEYYERHNMNLVRGWSHCVMSKWAKLYWNDEMDPNKEREPIYEYLVKLPVKIGKEVLFSELVKEYDKNNITKVEKSENFN